MSPAVKVVRSSRVSSLETRVEMDRRAPSTGMLVKRLTTSKLTIRSPTFTISFLILCANLAEFFTNESVLPVSVDRILASSLASL